MGKVCSIKGCPNIAVAKGRCPQHPVIAWEGKTWKDNPWSDPELKRLRRQVIKEEPNCRYCGRATTSVDHILPRAEGGSHARGNLQGLCTDCRKAKDARDSARGRLRNKQ